MKLRRDLSSILNPEDWDVIVIPVSGGKDSQAVLSLAVATPGVRERLRVVHQFTGYDHSLTLKHMAYMAEHYDVKIEETRSSKYDDVFDLIKKERYFPSSLARNCTSRLKIIPFGQWLFTSEFHKKRTLVLQGMRGAESQSRNEKYGELERPTDIFSICDLSKDYPKRIKAIQFQLPIVDWSLSQVFDYLRATKAKINPLYAKGHSRVGCYPCLLAGDKEWELAARDPEGQAHMRRLIAQEDEFLNDPSQKRKLIRIHPVRDVRAVLARGEQRKGDPFGFGDEDEGGCVLCNF